MTTQSLVWGKGGLGRGSRRLCCRSLLLVAACVSALLVAPTSWAQNSGSITDATQKQTKPNAAKKLPPATKKSADGKRAAKHDGHGHDKAPRFSLPDTKKPAAKKGAASIATAAGKAKASKSPAKDKWQSTCGKDKRGAATPTKVAGTKVTGAKKKASPSAVRKAAKLVVVQREISKEPVWNGEMIECEWVLKNEGDITLSITARGG